MKIRCCITLLVIIIFFIACGGKTAEGDTPNDSVETHPIATNTNATDTFESGKIINQVVCKGDTNQSYALYIPARSKNEILPVIYFFDPHADGSLPVSKYKALADKYEFILIGSNNSKNGNDWSTTENIWSTLSGESQKQLKINPSRIYVCGFSGGAKVAGYVALNHPGVKAVIANGAGLPDETPPGNFNFTLTSIAGEGDMNMTDLVAFNNELDKTQTRHRVIFFDGIHEWAPANTMDIAFAGLQLDAMAEKAISKDGSFISQYNKESKERVDKYLAANNFVKAEQECKLSTSMLDQLTADVSWFKEKDISITQSPSWQKQQQARQNLLITEQKLKAGYRGHFQQVDINYWKKTISDLQAKAKVHSAEGAMYQRLDAYLSLAFYSLSNRFIVANQNEEASYFVDLYKLVDPSNSEAWYFSAVMNARANNVKGAEGDLQRAVALGFRDKGRMEREGDFKRVGEQIDFAKIEGEMKK